MVPRRSSSVLVQLLVVGGVLAFSPLLFQSHTFAASSWNPTLLVNTEAFQVIDDTDSSANIILKFGGALQKTLTYNRSTLRFEFNDALHVTGNLSTSGTLTVEGAGTFEDGLTFGDAIGDAVTVNAGTWTFVNDTDFALSGGVNGLSFDTSTLSIDAQNNRVGIGTTAPQNTLHISTANTAYGNTIASTNVVITTTDAQGINKGPTIGLGGYIDDAATAQRLFGVITGRKDSAVSGSQAGYLSFGTNSNGTMPERMRITSAGLVGINTIAPETTLDIAGSLSGTTILSFGLSSCNASDQKLIYNSSTNKFECGTDLSGGDSTPEVGTAAFSGAVRVVGDPRYVNVGGDTMTGALTIQKNAGTATGNTLVVDTIGLVYDATNKRVGIGTAAPKAKFDTVGTISGSSLRVADLSNSGAVVYMSGSTLKSTARGSSGTVLVSQGASTPLWKNITGGMVWYLSGNLTTETNAGPTIKMPLRMTITGVSLYAKGPPAGQAIIVDINKDGTTLFSTRPQINAGSSADSGGAAFNVTSLVPGSIVTVDVDQVGSTVSGSGLTVILYGTPSY